MHSQDIVCKPCEPTDRRVEGVGARSAVPGVIGLCCTAFCLVGIPALTFLAPAAAAFTHSVLMMALLSTLSFGLMGWALTQGYRRHRRVTPAILAGIAAALALLEFTGVWPHLGMLAASALLAAAWTWDHFLSKEPHCHALQGKKESHECH